jgi:hypothetical protein
MSLIEAAKKELDLIGMTDDDLLGEGIDFEMRNHILRMVEEFGRAEHSGASASYSLGILKDILAWKPLSALTGNDDEWCEVVDGVMWQNKRCSTIFKDTVNGTAYNIDGIVFYDWHTDEETGEKSKCYFTSSDSRVAVTFPHTVPDSPEYKERIEE